MKSFVIFVFIYFSINYSFAQWQNLGIGFNRAGYVLLYDSTDNNLYVGGDFEYADSVLVNGYAKWDGLKWDSMGKGALSPGYSITKYQGNIYASSAFSYTNSSPDCCNWFALWNGQIWDTLNQKVNDLCNVFKEYNNELYMGGTFSKTGSQNANLLAKFDGNNFTPFNVPSEAGGYSIKAIEFFQGQMYVGGNFYDTITGVNDLERWDGTSFQPFGGNGLAFGTDGVSGMEIYQNDLYIAGNFWIATGSPANNIMRWDGNQFHDLGGGLNGGVLKMHIFNNLLYVCGAFTIAGSVAVNNGLAKWDGNNWSTVLPSTFNYGIGDFYINENDLYITGSFTMIDAMPFNYIAKYANYTAISETTVGYTFTLSPNPAINKITIQSNSNLIVGYKIYDTFGRRVKNGTINFSSNEVGISELESGLYFLNLQTSKGSCTKKFVKE